MKRRLLVGAVTLAVWSVAIEARLVYLQVIRHGDLSAKARNQQTGTVETAANRGDILDRNGRVLAYSVEAESIYAVPSEIDNVDKVAAALCGALDDCSARDREAINDRIRRGRSFAYVERQVSPNAARRVAALRLDGVGLMNESRRYYPNKDLAAHVLGYVGIDNKGRVTLDEAREQLTLVYDTPMQTYNGLSFPTRLSWGGDCGRARVLEADTNRRFQVPMR